MSILSGIIEVKCGECLTKILVDATDIELDAADSVERSMGPETFWYGSTDVLCFQCLSVVSLECTGSEYPIGAFEIDELDARNGKIVGMYDVATPSAGQIYSLDTEANIYLPAEKALVSDLGLGASELISVFSQNPQLLYEITAGEFEEVVAEIFRRHGFEVLLTPKTRDGGRDIIAIQRVLGIPSKFIIECKRYKKDRPVGVGVVRSLFGVQSQEGANKSIVATTSHFTRGAIDFAEQSNTRWQMELADYHDIVNWLKHLPPKGHH